MATPTPTMELLAAVRDMLNAHAKTVTGDDAAACEAAAEAVNAAFRFIDPDDDCDPPDDPPPNDPPEEMPWNALRLVIQHLVRGDAFAIDSTPAKQAITVYK